MSWIQKMCVVIGRTTGVAGNQTFVVDKGAVKKEI
jgi:hypothetical protein